MTTWSSDVCHANGIRIRYLRTGGGKPPVVLLHGLMGSGACWTPLARALEAEFDVVMPDARGHGGSSAPDQGYRYDDLASDVVGLIRCLELSRPILLGHSMGGMTAAVVASRHAELLRGLVLVDPTFLSPERQREVYESDIAEQHRRALGRSKAELVADARARHPHRPLELLELQAEARLHTCPAAFDVLAPPNPDYRDVVRAIDVPTLLVIGDSTVVTLEMATELRGLDPRVRIEQLRSADHGLPFDHPERVAELVASFLPIRRQLSQDHSRLDALLARAAAGEAEAYAQFRAGLLRHIAMEEKVLFAEARKWPELTETIAQLHADHAALASLLVPPPTAAILRTIRDILDEHNPIEEREGGLYEACERLAGADAGELLARMSALPAVRASQHVDEPRIHEHIARMLDARKR